MGSFVFVDVDGVLADFVPRFSELAFEITGKCIPPTPREIRTWDWNGILTRQELSKIWSKISKIENFWVDLPSLMDDEEKRRFIEICQELELDGVEVIFITSRIGTGGRNGHEQTAQWLTEKLGIERPSLILFREQSGKVEFIEMIREKSNWIAIVDDNPLVTSGALRYCELVVSMDYPYCKATVGVHYFAPNAADALAFVKEKLGER